MDDIQNPGSPGADQPEGSDSQAGEGQDPIRNLKAEMARKLSHQESKVSELVNSNKAILEQLQALTQQRSRPEPQDESSEDLATLQYQDPKKYAETVAEKASRKALEVLDEHTRTQNAKTAVLNSLYREYPELSDTTSSISQKALEIYNGLSKSEQNSPSSFRLAVREAAAEVGLLPVSKRRGDTDDFVIAGNRTSSSKPSRKNTANAETEIDERVMETARLFGLDPENPETRKNLAKHSKRTWNKYSS